jgi:hypothetical protein
MSITAGPEQANSKYIPDLQVGAVVEIISEPGIFLVSHIDTRRHVVNLLPAQGGMPQVGIHISAIRVHGSSPVRSYLLTERRLISELLHANED